jgi:AraC-like DNA-binding protein
MITGTTTAEEPLPERTFVEASGEDGVVEAIRASFGAITWFGGLAEDAGPLRFENTQSGPLGVGRARLPLSAAVDEESWPAGLMIVDVAAGRMERRLADTVDHARAGELLLAARPDASYGAHSEDLDAKTATLESDLLRRVADTPSATGPVRFTGYHPITPAAADQWRATRAFAAETLADPETAAQPLITGNLARLLAAVTLATFPNTTEADEAGPDRADATPDALRRAIAFIESHADADIGLAEIAASAYVTPRAIQYAFRRHHDSTPMAYLRRVRLDAAHRELLAAAPGDGATVTTIAARWGFAHPGRFAASYRRAYRQTPGEALRA